MRFVTRIYFDDSYLSYLIFAKDIDSASHEEDDIINDLIEMGHNVTCAELDYLIPPPIKRKKCTGTVLS